MLRACIIGHPVAHSRSPLIHNYWIRQHGIAGGDLDVPLLSLFDDAVFHQRNLHILVAGDAQRFELRGANVERNLLRYRPYPVTDRFASGLASEPDQAYF